MARKKVPARKKRRAPILKGWVWTDQRDRAAELLASGVSVREVGDQCGTNKKAIELWKKSPEFRVRVKEHERGIRSRFMNQALGTREKRVAELADLYSEMKHEIGLRAKLFQERGIEHGETGLIVESFKSIGSGEFAEKVSEFAFDTPLVGRMQSVLEQIAKELGQWSDKKTVEHEVTLTAYDIGLMKHLTNDELAQLIALGSKISRPIDVGSAPAGPGDNAIGAGTAQVSTDRRLLP